MPKHDDCYCGGPATSIIFRGRTTRLFVCDSCVYEGGGRKMPYAREVPEKDRKSGTFYGPERRCGERVA